MRQVRRLSGCIDLRPLVSCPARNDAPSCAAINYSVRAVARRRSHSHAQEESVSAEHLTLSPVDLKKARLLVDGRVADIIVDIEAQPASVFLVELDALQDRVSTLRPSSSSFVGVVSAAYRWIMGIGYIAAHETAHDEGAFAFDCR